MVGGVDPQHDASAEHYAEVDLTPEDDPVRGWRVRCVCSWTGVWRGTLSDAVAEYDEHLAEHGIFVADGDWWAGLPLLAPVEQLAPDAEALGTACRIWAIEASARLEKHCRWLTAPGDGAGR
jgi:hypothetical protein